MRRNDFKEIASIVRKHKLNIEGLYNSQIPLLLLNDLIEDFCVVFKKSNPSFDKSKFMKACGWYNG
jgi:hypothetical protein